MKDIVKFIKEEMAAHAMTYDLLAEKAGMSKQNLWMKLNKNTRPNFDTVIKILKALDLDITIEKMENTPDPEQDLVQKFFECAEEEQVGYDCIVKLLEITGNTIVIKTHKNEQNVKKGIDAY